MLTLLIGKDWVRNRDTVLNMVAKDVAAGKTNRVLLVPELISHDVERRLCVAAGDTATLYAEVLSFTRMVRAVSDCTQRGIAPCLDNGGRLVAMAATTRQLHSVLKAYASLETKPEFLTELVAAVDEFKQCCITSSDLAKAASQMTGNFAQKLEELSLILDTYDGICRRGKLDPADQMSWLLEQMEDSTYAQDRVFYVDGFPDFTKQHMAILEHIIMHSESVTVTVNCDKLNSDSMGFENTGATAEQLRKFAQDNGVAVEIRYIPDAEDTLSKIRDRLYRGDTTAADEYGACISAYHAGSVYQECVLAAQHIRDKIAKGDRYRDISIVCPNINGYKNTISSVFHRFDIPLYISGTEKILERPVISALLTAVDAALGGFESNQVLNYLKSAICPLSPDMCDAVENYAYAWNIQGTMWSKTWTMHPKGIGADWYRHDYEFVDQLNAAKDLAIAPLLALQNGFAKATNLSEQVRAVYRFMEDVNLCATFHRLADISDKHGDHRNAQIFNQLWEILMAALEQLHDVLGTTIWDADTFARLLRLLLTQYDIGTIPPVLDSVVVGPTRAMRCQQAKHLMILGADEGSFPSYSVSGGVLSDRERHTLRTIGVSLLPGSEGSLQSEFYDIYGVICGARETVYISSGPVQPSFIFRRMAELSGGAKKIDDDPTLFVGDRTDAGALLSRMKKKAVAMKRELKDTAENLNIEDPAEKMAAEETVKKLSSEVTKEIEKLESSVTNLDLKDLYDQLTCAGDYKLGRITKDHVKGMYGEKLYVSPTSVDMQARCRLQFFLWNGVRARCLKPYTIDPAQFGTYVHYVLEHAAKEVMARGGFRVVSLDETIEIAKVFSDEYIKTNFDLVESVRQNYLLQRNLNELLAVVEELWSEMSQSQFDPKHFELEFGYSSDDTVIEIKGKDMSAYLKGKVDRIDIWTEDEQSYFRVVDYKSGKNVKVDYCNIQNGIGLQMLLYMFALEEMGKDRLGADVHSAGVMYFPARVNTLLHKTYPDDKSVDDARQADWVRSTLLLKNNRVLNAMCTDLKKIGVKSDNEGKLTGEIVTREQFDMLKKYINKVLEKLVNEIASGCVDPNPYDRGERNNACLYCDYASICHPEENAERRPLTEVRFAKFWENLEEEMSENG